MDHRLGFNFGFLMDLEGEYPSNVTPKAPRLTAQQEKLNRALDFVGCSETVLPAGDYWLTVNKTQNPCKEILYIDESPWIPQVFIDRCTLAFEAPSKPKKWSPVGARYNNPYDEETLKAILKGVESISFERYNGEVIPLFFWNENTIGSLWKKEYKNDPQGIKSFTILKMK